MNPLTQKRSTYFRTRHISVVKNYWIIEKEVGEINYEFNLDDEYYYLEDVESIRRLPDSKNGKVRLEFQFKSGIVTKTAHNNG